MMRRFFFQHLKRYFMLLMIPSLLLLAAVFAISVNSWSRSVRSSSTEALDSIHASFLSTYESTCTQQNMMLVNPQLTLSLRKILMRSKMDYADYVFLQSMRSILMTTAAANQSVESIYMYLDGYDNFLSSETGLQQLSRCQDAGWYEIYTALPSARDNVAVRRSIPGVSERPVITLFQRLTFLKGVLVVNISESTFMDSMSRLIPFEGSALIITDYNGELLMSTGVDEPAVLNEALEAQEPGTQFYMSAAGRHYLATTYRDPDLDLGFALLIPAKTLLTGILSELAAPLLLILLDTVVILLLSYYSARRNLRRINSVLEIFGSAAEQALKPEEINTEYDLIIDNVIRSQMKTALLDKQLAEEKYRKQAAELAALQLQINPHFLMNTLQTVEFESCRLTGTMQSPVSRMIDDLSDILRYSLAGISDPVALNEELVNVRKYVEIQNFRFQDLFTVNYDIDDTLLQVPFHRLLIQPLVENSISHGIRPAMRKGTITISIRRDEKRLLISCADDGVGMSNERLSELLKNLREDISTRCIGLNNVNRRLQLYYGEGSALQIASIENQGTTVSFSIPYTQPQ